MALPVNIKNLVNGTSVESERIEFKEGFNPEAILHSICAFANDLNNWGGGYIIIGIKEDSGRPVLPPIGLNQNQIDPYQKKVIELCYLIEPFYFPQILPYDYDGKTIIVIWVSGGDNRPYRAPKSLGNKKDKALYIRRASTSTIANSTEERHLLERAARIPFDDRVSHFGKMEEINPKLIQDHLREIKSDLLEESQHLTTIEFYRKMEIVRGPDENPRPLNIGLLLFSNKPEIHFKGAVIDVIIYGDESTTVFIEKQFSEPVHIQLTNALNYIKTNVIQEQVVKISGQEQAKRTLNYPFDAIEEALVNAVYHRSYEDHRHTEVNVFNDRIEILSYPGPLPPITKEILFNDRIIARDYRNRRIGDYLKELKLSEGRGSGIPTIRKKMEEIGCPPPEFITDDDKSYFLTILKINPEWDKKNNARPNGHSIVQLTNNEQLLLEFCLNESRTFKEINSIFIKLNSKEVKKILDSVLEMKYISEKRIAKFIGIMKISVYTTTKRGIDVLSTSF
ncbi:MAG TPA: putative DNA binding domain-containing protein [Ignavibacteria bacterium]|nr:putative DNA binding domain-containing protein [Ignavibacteria bacterium]HMQ97629.1 putative DNA binding domain-containing protein [Ignavibacteria bacterium]